MTEPWASGQCTCTLGVDFGRVDAACPLHEAAVPIDDERHDAGLRRMQAVQESERAELVAARLAVERVRKLHAPRAGGTYVAAGTDVNEPLDPTWCRCDTDCGQKYCASIPRWDIPSEFLTEMVREAAEFGLYESTDRPMPPQEQT